MKFFALDVETANADYSSICQIGIAEFNNGELTNSWMSLVNPKCYFDDFNISIHGINEDDVKNAPTFSEVYTDIKKMIGSSIVVHHMSFDKIALNRACNNLNLELLDFNWIDSAKIVRRTWSEFSNKGYGLKNITKHLNIKFKHHDALEDAIATGKVVNIACNQTDTSIDDWVKRIKLPINLEKAITNLSGNPKGSLFGENVVFTGALSMPRNEVSKLAASLGCDVSVNVTKNTTILVVGIQDESKLGNYTKSSKHRKAENLITKGVDIQIISEKDFLKMCDNT
jgi:DNA polymerase-3 subunit epsilon